MEGGEGDGEEEESSTDEKFTRARRARLLDSYSDPEQPDPAAARAGVAPYLDDIDRHMRSLEDLRRPRDYMPSPSPATDDVITPAWRAELVGCLVEVADRLLLPADTLHLAVSFVDRFLSVAVIILTHPNLIGVAALLVAAKYEDKVFVRDVDYFACFTEYGYTRQHVKEMEARILIALNYEIGSPTARTFLRRYITARPPPTHTKAKTLEFLCSYLAELSLMDYDCTRFKPSVVAAACLFMAWFTVSPNYRSWNLPLQRSTNYMLSDLKSCILRIHDLQLNIRYPEQDIIIEKYSHCQLDHVSVMPPPTEIYEYFLTDLEE